VTELHNRTAKYRRKRKGVKQIGERDKYYHKIAAGQTRLSECTINQGRHSSQCDHPQLALQKIDRIRCSVKKETPQPSEEATGQTNEQGEFNTWN
jgi:hypothetical protein